MQNNENLLEGFWDHLITKVKHGALAGATALGSSTAQGKLSASLLGTELYRQYKNWTAKTGTEDDPKSFGQFMTNLGFSQGFTQAQSQAFKSFVDSSGDAGGDTGGDNKFAIDGSNKQEPTSGEPEKAAPATPAEPASTQDAPKAQTPGDKQRALRSAQRQNTKRESVEASPDMLTEASDSQLRSFFNQMAKDAFANGEAKSAAKHELKTAIVTPTDYKQAPQGGQQQSAPAQQQAQPSAPAAAQAEPEQSDAGTPPAPAAPIAPAPAPQPASSYSAADMDYSPEEKQILDLVPGPGLEKQITASNPEVQDLARKIFKDAILKYQKQNPPKSKPAPKK